jgi:hypothetical protein
VGRIAALPTQSQVCVGGVPAPHGLSAPLARTIEMSPRESLAVKRRDDRSREMRSEVDRGLWAPLSELVR